MLLILSRCVNASCAEGMMCVVNLLGRGGCKPLLEKIGVEKVRYPRSCLPDAVHHHALVQEQSSFLSSRSLKYSAGVSMLGNWVRECPREDIHEAELLQRWLQSNPYGSLYGGTQLHAQAPSQHATGQQPQAPWTALPASAPAQQPPLAVQPPLPGEPPLPGTPPTANGGLHQVPRPALPAATEDHSFGQCTPHHCSCQLIHAGKHFANPRSCGLASGLRSSPSWSAWTYTD